MPDGTLQFMARVDPTPTLWEQNEIMPDSPMGDMGMRLLRAEARAVHEAYLDAPYVPTSPASARSRNGRWDSYQMLAGSIWPFT